MPVDLGMTKAQEEELYVGINHQLHLRLGEILQVTEVTLLDPSMLVEERKALKHMVLDMMQRSFENFLPKMKIAWAELVEDAIEKKNGDSPQG